MAWWTGALLLFSGGTFLFVATHTMQGQAAPTVSAHGHCGPDDTGATGYVITPKPDWPTGQTAGATAATVAGMMFPLVTLLFNHH